MTGLVLKLRPHETLLVNGVLMQNGARSARLRIRSRDVSILRMRDAMHPGDATTPLKRLYYVAQLAITGELGSDAAMREIAEGLAAFAQVARRDTDRAAIARLETALAEGKYFAVMRGLRRLFPVEARARDTAGARR